LKIPNKLADLLANLQEDTIIIGIRPKDILILKSDEEFPGLKLKGKISFTEMLGDESIAEVRLGQDLIKTSNIDSRRDELPVGSEVTLGVNEDKLSLFKKDGNRMDF
jgi:multiple sugar transport system ATP-binding protein